MLKTRAFFSEIFNWTFQEIPGFKVCLIFRTSGGSGGGVNLGPRVETPSEKAPILHIEIVDMEETLARIDAHGGSTILPRTKISGGFGYFALFLGNIGNRFGIWSN